MTYAFRQARIIILVVFGFNLALAVRYILVADWNPATYHLILGMIAGITYWVLMASDEYFQAKLGRLIAERQIAERAEATMKHAMESGTVEVGFVDDEDEPKVRH